MTDSRSGEIDLSDELQYQFTQATNPTTGKKEWVAEMRDEHDYIADIARSSYADMLHDDERNKLYHKAIQIAVKFMHNQGRRAKVLDIGTGTGLLSMMAANAGADLITAVEVFTPMANIAKKVTKLNGFSQIKVVNKHSTKVTVGKDGDMQEKANILVTELFDTELIGEGALAAYQHAHTFLMEEDCVAVPHRAIIKSVVVESSLMWGWNELARISLQVGDGNMVQVEPDPQIVEGCGVTAVHDIQLTEFPKEKLTELTEPFEVFEFNWADRKISDKARSKVITTKVIRDGVAQVVLSWWDLDMDREGSIVLSTAPKWHHPTPDAMQWRDHWLQSVYFLPQKLQCSKGNFLHIKAIHDAYSLCYQASNIDEFDGDVLTFPACNYPPRMLWSRSRVGKVNDAQLNRLYVTALNEISRELPESGVVFCASDFSILPLFAAQVCEKRDIVVLEQSKLAQRGLHNLSITNKLSLEVISEETSSLSSQLGDRKISLLFGEPHFTSSLLPWHDLYFWYLRTELNCYLSHKAKICPFRAHLCAAAVWFKDLWKIRAPVGTVEGFDLSPMDEMIEDALNKREYYEPEPHALWEYPNQLLTRPFQIMTFNFTDMVPDKNVTSRGLVPTEILKSTPTACHGVVLWMEYDLDSCRTISTGLVSSDDSNSPQWSMHHKQAVFLFKRPIVLSVDSKLAYDVTFLPSTGDVKVSFDVT